MCPRSAPLLARDPRPPWPLIPSSLRQGDCRALGGPWGTPWSYRGHHVAHGPPPPGGPGGAPVVVRGPPGGPRPATPWRPGAVVGGTASARREEGAPRGARTGVTRDALDGRAAPGQGSGGGSRASGEHGAQLP